MSVGLAVTKEILDNQIGYQVVQLEKAFQMCVDFKNKFLDVIAAPDGNGETYLTGQGYTADEIATIRATYTAISQLWDVGNGKSAVPDASDFFFDAPKLIGTNVT